MVPRRLRLVNPNGKDSIIEDVLHSSMLNYFPPDMKKASKLTSSQVVTGALSTYIVCDADAVKAFNEMVGRYSPLQLTTTINLDGVGRWSKFVREVLFQPVLEEFRLQCPSWEVVDAERIESQVLDPRFKTAGW